MTTNSRTANSVKNSIASMIYNIITILASFVLQSIFIRTLGAEYNGIKSLFQNIITMLSVIELGFGTAIVYNLYEPIKHDNTEKIRSIIKYYKKIYIIIGLVILSLGIIAIPFIPLLVGETSIQYNIKLIFLLYLINAVMSYFLSYKAAILHANQKRRILDITSLCFDILRNGVQALILIATKNYLLFLVAQILFTVAYNIFIYLFVDKKYQYLNNLSKAKNLDPTTAKNIKKKVNGLLYHKIGGFFVTGTDNILIALSKNLGILYVGYYNNYSMVIINVSLVFNNMIDAITASIGNLLTTTRNNIKKIALAYNSLVLISSWLYCFGATSIFCLMTPFITIWIGSEYILSNSVFIVLIINFYLNGIKRASYTFKTAAGIFYEDRFVPIAESIVNIVFSLLFMHYFGLAGVFMGTICSSFVTLLYSYPKYVYRKLTHNNVINYYKLYAIHAVISTLIFVITSTICLTINTNSLFSTLILRSSICLVIPNFLYFTLVRKTNSFQYVIKLLRKMKK